MYLFTSEDRSVIRYVKVIASLLGYVVTIRYGALVLRELRGMSPLPGDNPKKFTAWLEKIYAESPAPLKMELS